MSLADLPTIAVIADAHFHDLYGDYDFKGIETKNGVMTARRLTDTVRSTRVFNESYQALRAALDDIARRQIRHVVLLGDYSDDGQIATLAALQRLLDSYRHAYGMVFTAVPGNHDIFGPAGRHHGKRLLNADGSYTFVASSAEFIDHEANGFVLTPKMYCKGYPEGLQAITGLGFFHRDGDLYWETPFGTDDAPEHRLYNVTSPDGRNRYSLMDASYLVEPAPGLWLLMLDVNVFAPRNGNFAGGEAQAFVDSTNAGWNAVIEHKHFLFQWMQDVARRACEGGKCLLTFSHYPTIDMLNGTTADEFSLIGPTGAVKRTPAPATAQTIANTGIGVHFSGHLHINDTAQAVSGRDWLINVGVPSLVAFPPAFKIVKTDGNSIEIETAMLDGLARDAHLDAQYRTELALTRKDVGTILDTPDYGSFLSEHVQQLVIHRYLRKEWPKDLAAIAKVLTLADLVFLVNQPSSMDMDEATGIFTMTPKGHCSEDEIRIFCAEHTLHGETLQAVSFLELLGDWYRLRKASELAFGWICPHRLRIYQTFIALFASRTDKLGSLHEKIGILLRMMGAYMGGLPSRNFRIDLGDGSIQPL
ncbi:3',5'-cyclic AMP phosphodiesterase CpdA [Ochrobactrum daejeonense]|uniref:3',5'-cyclic AMP phosphodiesterase CpdA n=1 Tax=Brucella daejeonensis TaxID=659015 RepID=A0A7W9AUJ1_9HYPH|nr:metallophosphoesterase [Brucella daejeonensis]MBB5700781.1 3',5'-cyclic AMP phosphodiesterase CpdA [Brucella daejeonensis]